MRYSAEHKRETRARIMTAAGQLFRREGYGGSGIDGLTKAAGVTNGAFYGHFKSKSDAFRAATLAGIAELRDGITEVKRQAGGGWLRAFVQYYLGPKRTCELERSCGLASLAADVMRADLDTRAAFEVELLGLVDDVAVAMPGGDAAEKQDQALALLAMLSGGATLARAVGDTALSSRIAGAVERAAMRLAGVTSSDLSPSVQQ